MWKARHFLKSRQATRHTDATRRLLSNNNNNNRGSGAFERFREAAKKNKKQRQPSFAETFLDPAARGELKKHQSGIPKLAARQRKSKTDHDLFPGKEAQQVMPSEEPFDNDVFEEALDEPYRAAAAGMSDEETDIRETAARPRRDSTTLNVVYQDRISQQLPEGWEMGTEGDDSDEGWEEVKMDTSFLTRDPESKRMEALEEHYFGQTRHLELEEEYEEFPETTGFDPDNHPDITKEEDGTYVLHYDPESAMKGDDDDYDDSVLDFAYSYSAGAGEEEVEDNTPMVRQKQSDLNSVKVDDIDFEERFFHPSVFDVTDSYPGPMPDEIVNQIRPLQEEGPNLEDFLEATYRHPTKFAEVRRYNLHFESRREPKPIIPPSRKNPPYEWVKAHKKFLYVSGLPPKILDEEDEPDYDNPVHRNAIANLIAELFDVKPEHVFPASMTSAFIGIKDRYVSQEEAEKIAEMTENEIIMTRPITISAYDGKDYGDFTKESPECIVKLDNLPPRMTPAKLARDLFTPDSDLRIVYGQLQVENILMTSPTSALIRLDSAHHAESAITSEAVEVRLDELGEYPIDLFEARRELVPGGFTGPAKSKELKRLGSRLIVDGDVPSDKFFRSHAGCVHLRNVDDNVTNQDIADALQPYCANLRDVNGSVEWGTNMNGVRTGRAFVGFDRLGEAEAFVKAVSGRIKNLGGGQVIASLVRDKKIPGAKPREARPERTEEELLDDLNNWEKYVDPKELEELIAMGVNKKALDYAFRALRFQNTTYGAMDQALRNETLAPEKARGEEYRETVREYIATIKECMGTPEDPGDIYKSLHMPGEKIDLSIFEYEKRRQARLAKQLGD